MRFAFYGRCSTEDNQDPASSLDWQRTRCLSLIEPAGGRIVREYFDRGQSRSLPWSRRPEAQRLLADLRAPDRDFDAIVIGEPHRAFYGNQFSLTFPVFDHFGVELWVPEVGGRVDPDSEAHDLVMSIFGGASKGERKRIQTRVRSAMSAQAAHEGRFLGGRPPYGYLLVDAGPHPNPGKATDGKRLHRLDRDPITAPVVEDIFSAYVAGRGVHAIAEELNRQGVPSPSGYDPARNRHRVATKGAWSKGTVRTILGNPKYTGYHVWNRQHRVEVLLDLEDVAAGHRSKMTWNSPTDWIWSPAPTHPAIISREVYEQAAAQRKRGGARRTATIPRRKHAYCLSSRIFCDICGRRMQGSWNHEAAYYRCKFPNEYAGATGTHPQTVYVREDAVVDAVDRWLAGLLGADRIDHTVRQMFDAQSLESANEVIRETCKKRLAQCEADLESYRKLLLTGTEASVVAKWIADTEAERRLVEGQLAALPTPTRLSEAEIRQIVVELKDTVNALAAANAEQKAKLYAALGVAVTWVPAARKLVLESRPVPCTNGGVGGGT